MQSNTIQPWLTAPCNSMQKSSAQSPGTKQYLLCDAIFIKFKNRQMWYTILEVTIVVSFGEEGLVIGKGPRGLLQVANTLLICLDGGCMVFFFFYFVMWSSYMLLICALFSLMIIHLHECLKILDCHIWASER